nr:hypothetical protein K-LCC10_0173 [Kaumoebavirus]
MNVMNRKFQQYSATTLSMFEIIGAYFVDVYYNHLYDTAKTYKGRKEVSTITEGYKKAVVNYLKGFADKEKNWYLESVKGLHKYFQTFTKFSYIMLDEMYDKILSEIVPEDYIEDLNKVEKNFLIRQLLVKTLQAFTTETVCQNFKMIIDNHGNVDDVRYLQDCFIEIILAERDKIFSNFLNKNKHEMVPAALCKKLQAEIKKLHEVDARKNIVIKKLQEFMNVLKNQIKLRDAEIAQMKKGGGSSAPVQRQKSKIVEVPPTPESESEEESESESESESETEEVAPLNNIVHDEHDGHEHNEDAFGGFYDQEPAEKPAELAGLSGLTGGSELFKKDESESESESEEEVEEESSSEEEEVVAPPPKSVKKGKSAKSAKGAKKSAKSAKSAKRGKVAKDKDFDFSDDFI